VENAISLHIFSLVGWIEIPFISKITKPQNSNSLQLRVQQLQNTHRFNMRDDEDYSSDQLSTLTQILRT
jgi:hypothetical protein